MTRLCVSLTEKNTDDVLAALRALPRQANMAEVRVDAMESCDIERICAGKDRPIIVTNRPVREGGRSQQPEPERLAVLRRAAELGADFVDVELDSVAELGELPGRARKIVSYHNFDETPADLEAILRRLIDAGADVPKIAVMARDIVDVPRVLALLERHAARLPLIALSMGEAGVSSRVLAGKLGAFLTFASLRAGSESGPGQVPVEQMISMYRFGRISRGTAVYGVVANPVAHSMSPQIHNAAFAHTGIDAVYLPFKVTDCAAFLAGFERYDLKGLSVTIPHKETMLQLVTKADDMARATGALNTMTRTREGWYGTNTDAAAALGATERAAERAGLRLSECHALVVGAGGAGRAIACCLRPKVRRLTIANRTVERAEKLAAEFDAEACGLSAVADLRPDLVINTTAVGMWPKTDETPVPAAILRDKMAVVDAVYNPIRTRLLREADEAGAVTASGLEWFVSQAAGQYELWTGRTAPRAVMEEVVRARLKGA